MFESGMTPLARWREGNEIDALTDAVLQDIGLTRRQLEAFAKMPEDTPQRMADMAKTFGLTEDDLRARYDLYLDMLGTCARCADRRTCAKVLAAKGTSARNSAYSFCPNVPEFVRMSAENHS